jgi:hypothetical protein
MKVANIEKTINTTFYANNDSVMYLTEHTVATFVSYFNLVKDYLKTVDYREDFNIDILYEMVSISYQEKEVKSQITLPTHQALSIMSKNIRQLKEDRIVKSYADFLYSLSSGDRIKYAGIHADAAVFEIVSPILVPNGGVFVCLWFSAENHDIDNCEVVITLPHIKHMSKHYGYTINED